MGPLSYYGKDRNQAIEQFKLFTECETNKKFIDIDERMYTRDEEVEEHFNKQGLCDVGEFYKLGNRVRNEKSFCRPILGRLPLLARPR